MIEVRGICHSFGPKVVLKDINVTLNNGTIVGLVGVNGAGKSTFLRILAGVYQPESGSVFYDGGSPSRASTRQNIFFLPDDPYYTHSSSAKDIFNLYKNFYPQIDHDLFLKYLSAYNIEEKKPLRNFSKGMRRQVFIALALAIRPKYLLMDEAFDGLDPLSRKTFKDAIVQYVEQDEGTVIVSSHSLRELEDFCDSFILIDETRVKHHGSIDEHTSRLCKFEMAFADPPNEATFRDLPVVFLSINGRFVKIALAADAKEMQERLSALNPLIMEEREVDFEEAFIYDVQRGGVRKNEK